MKQKFDIINRETGLSVDQEGNNQYHIENYAIDTEGRVFLMLTSIDCDKPEVFDVSDEYRVKWFRKKRRV